jgi:pimeloyl-ACP methyl ester carboxylesterase
MSYKNIFPLVLIFLLSVIPFQNASAQDIPAYCKVILPHGDESGEKYLICIPPDWKGELLVYAHGYVAFNQPVDLPWDQIVLPDGTSLPELIMSTGFGFATTSYSVNGLAIKEGVAEVVALTNYFDGENYPVPELVLLAGPSEGGLITALAIEQYPDIFDGGLSTCGPIGDFRGQIDYWGDFRVVFNYFYPGLLRPNPVEIPSKVIENWDTKYEPRILKKVQEKPEKIAQLLTVTNAPYDPDNPGTVLQTIEHLLWYNVFATNDGVAKLGGQPYDNQDRKYAGSLRDDKLNRKVQRFSGDQNAWDEIRANYETTGVISVPLVTMHTTGDEVVPFWHMELYNDKIKNNSNAPYLSLGIDRYGHCNFSETEVLTGFALLYFMVQGYHSDGILSMLPDPEPVYTYLDTALQRSDP